MGKRGKEGAFTSHGNPLPQILSAENEACLIFGSSGLDSKTCGVIGTGIRVSNDLILRIREEIMILSCGEALIDMLPRQSAAGEACYMPVAGGAVFNTAIALARLGAPSAFFTGISTDFFGDLLVNYLNESKVDTRYVVRSDHPETLAFVRLVDGHAQYAFYDEGTAGRLLAQSDIPALDANVAALQFGAISLIPEPCGGTYEEMMRREHKSRVISFDPNIRTSFIKDKAAHRARMDRMLAMSDIVKLSDEDLVFFDAGGDFDGFAARLLAGNAKLVAMTRGSRWRSRNQQGRKS